MKRPIALLFLLSILLSLSHTCIHDQFKKEVLSAPDLLEDASSSGGRMLASGTKQSIRIVAYYCKISFISHKLAHCLSRS